MSARLPAWYLAGCLLLAGCGGGSPSPDPAEQPPAPVAPERPSVRPAAPAPAGGPTRSDGGEGEAFEPPDPIPDTVPPHVFGAGDVSPQLKTLRFEVDGEPREYRVMSPGRTYEEMAFPAWPQFVPLHGALPATRRILHYSCTINEQGFRAGRSYSRTGRPGTWRVAVLGTGVTFGEGVEDAEVYPEVLQRRLDADPPWPGAFEVLNFGVPSTTLDLAVSGFHKLSNEYRVDFWVLALGVNDPLPMFHRSIDEYRQNWRDLLDLVDRSGKPAVALVEPANTFYPWMDAWLAYREVFAEEVESRLPVIDVTALLDCEERRSGLRLEAEGDRQKLVAYRGGTPHVLLEARNRPHPKSDLGPPYGAPSVASDIYEYLDGHRVYLRTFVTDVHLDARGHELVADFLYRYLEAAFENGDPREGAADLARALFPEAERCGLR